MMISNIIQNISLGVRESSLGGPLAVYAGPNLWNMWCCGLNAVKPRGRRFWRSHESLGCKVNIVYNSCAGHLFRFLQRCTAISAIVELFL